MSDSEDKEWESEKDRIREVVDKSVAAIREHVDTVQVFVTLHRDDAKSTMSYEKGAGCFYSRQGLITEWLLMQQQFQKNHANRIDEKDEE